MKWLWEHTCIINSFTIRLASSCAEKSNICSYCRTRFQTRGCPSNFGFMRFLISSKFLAQRQQSLSFRVQTRPLITYQYCVSRQDLPLVKLKCKNIKYNVKYYSTGCPNTPDTTYQAQKCLNKFKI